MHKKDNIYQQPVEKPEDFVFDARVAQVFPDMVKRSVPGYANVIAGTGLAAADYLQDGTRCYDLGCSVGASTFSLLEQVKQDSFEVIAVDNSEDMIMHCQHTIQSSPHADKVTCLCADIRDIDIKNASVVIMNYTLQFIPLSDREPLLRNIYEGMNDEALLVLSEKLAFDNKAEQQRQTSLHESFKRTQGYSELEISQKRSALENVLIPEPFTTHINRLQSAGFRDAQLWFRSINFASILAWK